MYQRNAEQRNRTNPILVYFFLSSSKPRPKLSQNVRSENLKCAIYSQFAKIGERKKFRISQQPRAEYLLKASGYFRGEAYTQTADLNTPSRMFAADLY